MPQGHRRVHDLVAYLETLRGRYGLWQHPNHPQLSGWLSFDLERSLHRLADGDRIGNEEPVSFTPPPDAAHSATDTTLKIEVQTHG